MENERTMGRRRAAALAGLFLIGGCSDAGPDAAAEPGARAATLAAACVTRACYGDGDGDGYGVTPPVVVCALGGCPHGKAESAGDCNDANPDVHPMQREQPSDGVDNDCNGQPDEGAFQGPPYYRTDTSLEDVSRPYVRLNHEAEIAHAWDGTLYGKVYYRKVAKSSEPYRATGFLRPAMGEDYDGVQAGFRIEGLAPFTAYEMRVDFYRRQVLPGVPATATYVRIAPRGGCAGDSGSTPPCSNTTVHYGLTPPVDDAGPLGQGRADFVGRALLRKRASDDGFGDAENDSQFYAGSAAATPLDLDPSIHDDEEALRSWFASYPGALSAGTGYDLAALRPGDWLSVDGPRGSSEAPRTRLFLAHDDDDGTYWFLEGDARLETPDGLVFGAVRVAAGARCRRWEDDGSPCPMPVAGACAPGCDPVRWVGRLVPAMID